MVFAEGGGGGGGGRDQEGMPILGQYLKEVAGRKAGRYACNSHSL